MTVQANAGVSATDSPRWEKLKNWAAAVEEAIAYDPHEQAAKTIRELRLSVTSLETRMLELEKRDST